MELFHGDGAIELYFRFCNATREVAKNFPIIIVMCNICLVNRIFDVVIMERETSSD